MGRPLRAEQFSADEVSIVHVTQRCVRRAYLTGVDSKTGIDYSFRQEWIRRRLEALASVFGIDVLAYAIMSNHIHIILRNRPEIVAAWTDKDVAVRWLRVFPGRRMEEYLADPTDVEVEALVHQRERLALIRRRLSDISWFMRALCEPIARMANKQDQCTGRFWEGRFKAKRISDEAGLLACAMYVDLNPIRASLAESPETARHTSAYDRIEGEKGSEIESAAFDLMPITREQRIEELSQLSSTERRWKFRASGGRKPGRRIRRDSWLAPLTIRRRELASGPEVSGTGVRASDSGFLSIEWRDYLELLRWTASQKARTPSCRLPDRLSAVVSSLGIEASMWHDLVWNFNKFFGRSGCAGTPTSMAQDAKRHNRAWYQGCRQARDCFAAS